MKSPRPIESGVGDHPPERSHKLLGRSHTARLGAPSWSPPDGAAEGKRPPSLPVCLEHDSVEPCPFCHNEEAA